MERLLDSVILIDHLNGINQATRFILELDPAQTAISVITRTEILAGVDEVGRSQVAMLVDQYHLLIEGLNVIFLNLFNHQYIRRCLPHTILLQFS